MASFASRKSNARESFEVPNDGADVSAWGMGKLGAQWSWHVISCMKHEVELNECTSECSSRLDEVNQSLRDSYL